MEVDDWEFGRQLGGALIGHELVDRVDPGVVEAFGGALKEPMMHQAREMASAMRRFNSVMSESATSLAALTALISRSRKRPTPWKRNIHRYGR